MTRKQPRHEDHDDLEDLKLDQQLRRRPGSGPVDASDQDRYYDSGPRRADSKDQDDAPWLDTSEDREREL